MPLTPPTWQLKPTPDVGSGRIVITRDNGMSARFEFIIEARGGDADLALRRLLELLRDTAEAGLRDLQAPRPKPVPAPDQDDAA